MKYWALGLVLLVGGSNQVGQYQKSAEERFIIESDASDRLHQRLNDFQGARALALNGEATPETLQYLKDNEPYMNDLKAAVTNQDKRVRSAVHELANQ
jgi:hypothetical protein